jgi:hypothetical protein
MHKLELFRPSLSISWTLESCAQYKQRCNGILRRALVEYNQVLNGFNAYRRYHHRHGAED